MGRAKLIYLMDPHCGWCYGYSETISKIHDHALTEDGLQFEVVPGGLFVPKIRGSAEFADGKRPIASRIEDLFGVTFSPKYFENVLGAQWIDSAPSNQAIQACNVIERSRTLDLSRAIINAAFIEGRDISRTDIVLEIAEKQGFDTGEFGATMTSQRIDDDLTSAQRFPAEVSTGFPSVFLCDAESGQLVHLGRPDLSTDALAQALVRR